MHMKNNFAIKAYDKCVIVLYSEIENFHSFCKKYFCPNTLMI